MKTTVIIINVILLIILIPSVFAAMMSPMMFDAPGSEKSKKTWLLFSCVVALPVLIVVAQIVAWIAFNRENYDLALRINYLPIADIVIVGFLLFVIDSFVD